MPIVTSIDPDEIDLFFRAFFKENDLKIGDEWYPYQYMAWNNRKWREWKILNGYQEIALVAHRHRDDFGNWLIETIPGL